MVLGEDSEYSWRKPFSVLLETLIDPRLNRRRHPLDEFYPAIAVRHDDKAGLPSRAAFGQAMKAGVVASMADEETVSSQSSPISPVTRPVPH